MKPSCGSRAVLQLFTSQLARTKLMCLYNCWDVDVLMTLDFFGWLVITHSHISSKFWCTFVNFKWLIRISLRQHQLPQDENTQVSLPMHVHSEAIRVRRVLRTWE